MLKILKTIKTFLLGLITGIITAIISYLYIKNQKIIKKIVKIKKRNESENDIYLQPQNRRQEIKKENTEEQGRIRQSNRDLGERESALEGNLQCGQLEQYKNKNRDKKRNVLGNMRVAQGQIQSNLNNKLVSDNGVEQVKRNRQDTKHDTD